jgi:3-hydroxyacyl-[acyl-carrier-protein] dehydratase
MKRENVKREKSICIFSRFTSSLARRRANSNNNETMRWIWIDKFTEFTSKTSATAVKNVSLAEEHLHDLYPAFPIVPHSLIVEGMAQTAGILVGEARNFQEKVILAKVGRATFHRLVRPGDTVLFNARIDQLNEHGASISGTVTCDAALVAEIDLMFSHIDQNMGGVQFPEHNFVFTEQFTELLKTYRTNTNITI